ncbi:hypothetical protein RFI_17009 [Reticulomyxa filosa]|uniref:Uncharacterized protein n=1 Tax=Reticulomyxa filosa TaxID=46433 RepID=X6N4G1_RETFI|nr:hypothetical protein RFI_17009 [Reticulomyxa filosa]|eukprot:ETO20212.1 hypothetical protein RFI_17009 [Reticulomyxa filosa]
MKKFFEIPKKKKDGKLLATISKTTTRINETTTTNSLQKQEIATQQVLLEQMDDCFIMIRRYLNEVIRVRRLKKEATNKHTKVLQIANFAMAQSIFYKLNESVALNPGPKLNEKTFNEDTIGTGFGRILSAEVNKNLNRFHSKQENDNNNTKGAVNKLLPTKTKYMDKSSIMFDIDPDCLDDKHSSPEEGVENNNPDFDQETIEYPFFSTGSKNHSTKHNKQNNKMDIECDNTISQFDLDKDKKNRFDDDPENIFFSDERLQIDWEDYFNQDVNKNKYFNFFTKNKQEMDTDDDNDNFMTLQSIWDCKKDNGQDKNHDGSKNSDKRTTK